MALGGEDGPMNAASDRVTRRWVGPIFILAGAVALALLVGSLFIAIAGASPFEAYRFLLLGAFSRAYNLGEILVKATPLVIIGTGIALAFRGGLINLGGDGQFQVGALAAILVSLGLAKVAPWVVFPLGTVAAIAAGAFWGGIAGVFKSKLGANEVITTIMLNYVALQILSYAVHGPLKEPGGFLPQTPLVCRSAQLPLILSGTRVHLGVLIGLACLVLYAVVLGKTVFGYHVRVMGGSLRAAYYGGVNISAYTAGLLALSGAFGGLAGAVEVFGVHHRVLEGICPGYGFTALVVALLGRLHPLGMGLAALFLSVLAVGVNVMQVAVEVPVALVYIIQGLIMLFFLAGNNAGSLFRRPLLRDASREESIS
jgi:simple sugar transport system permease protein